MVLLNRVGPVLAAVAAGAAFVVVFSRPQVVYLAAAGLLALLLWIASSLPAQGWSDRLQRWLALSMPALAGGWMWLFLQQGSWRLLLPLAVSLLVLVAGEVLFRASYGQASSWQRWLTVTNVVAAWLFFSGTAAASLLLQLTWPLLPLVAGVASVLLLAQGQWSAGVRLGPWWNLVAAGLGLGQLSWAILALPVVYPAQGALLTAMYGCTLWLYVRKGSGPVDRHQLVAAAAAVTVLTLGVIVAWVF